MFAANRQLLLILLMVTSSSVLWASEPNTTVDDVYDKIGRLIDSLTVWAVDTTASVVEFQDQGVEAPDSLDLTVLFPGALVVPDDSSNVYRITLPRYMDMLETSLLLTVGSNRSSITPTIRWTALVERLGEMLSIDDRLVSCDRLIVCDSVLVEEIRQQLTTLRTLGLPRGWRHSHPEDDGVYVMVTVRGRDNRRIDYTLNSWLQSLGRIASGRQVYAGLLDSHYDDGNVELKYYILLTYPGAQGHHFLEWIEQMEMEESVWTTTRSEVVFIPYVRTDNLSELFGQPAKSEIKPLEMRLRR